jgi:hypothetical protein
MDFDRASEEWVEGLDDFRAHSSGMALSDWGGGIRKRNLLMGDLKSGFFLGPYASTEKRACLKSGFFLGPYASNRKACIRDEEWVLTGCQVSRCCRVLEVDLGPAYKRMIRHKGLTI